MRALLSCFLVGTALAATAPRAAARPAAGELRCSMAGGFGLLLAGNRKLTCVYYRPDGAVEFYVGSTSRVGFDLGPTNAARLAFQVVGAPPATPAALQGDFAGAGAGLTIGQGVGASALVGGSGETLVPIANVYASGLEGNVGLAILHLDYAGMEPRRD